MKTGFQRSSSSERKPALRNPHRFASFMVMLFVAAFAAACSQGTEKQGTASVETRNQSGTPQRLTENKALVAMFYRALNDTAWRDIPPLLHPDYRHHYVADTGFASVPWSGFEAGYRSSLIAFPDWKITPVKMIAEGNQVAVLVKGQGTHLGSFAGIPGTKIRAGAPIMLIHEIKEGKLAADWEIMNTSAFMEQLKEE